MTATLTIAAPAKLNLFLHITGRRDDGYHELETLFQFIDVSDQLHLQVTNDGQISLISGLSAVGHDDNLVTRAAHLLLPYRKNQQHGARITLDKHLPMGAGLGGGSSDAASTLLALNQLWQLQLSVDQLAALGLQLGADVPVFVRGRAAFARGVGEQLEPASPPEAYYLVVNPGVHVSTAAVFNHPDLPRNTPPIAGSVDAWRPHKNDCEALVCSLYPPVAKCMNWLLQYAPTRMTGTGACVFACFDSKNEAQQVYSELPDEFTGFVAQGLNVSPAWQGLSISQ